MLYAMVSAAHPRPDTSPAAQVTVGRRCYAVGQKVNVQGSGFAASAPYDISLDGVDFGQSLTAANGSLAASFFPGGLGAGQAQIADTLTASDGTSSATTKFTITRRTGALFVPDTGSSPRRQVAFQVWDFAPTGAEVPVYLHYVSPNATAKLTVRIGTSAGQCGALVTGRRQLFPFNPGAGTWTLQFDTQPSYTASPAGVSTGLQIAIS